MPTPLLHCVRCRHKTGSKDFRKGTHGVHSVCTTCGGNKHSFVKGMRKPKMMSKPKKQKGEGFFGNLFSGHVGDAFDDLGNGATGIAHTLAGSAGAALPGLAMGAGIGRKRGGGRPKGSVRARPTKRGPKKGKGMSGEGLFDFLGI